MTEQKITSTALLELLENAQKKSETENLLATIDETIVKPTLSERVPVEDRSLLLANLLEQLSSIYETEGKQDQNLQWMILAVAYLLTTTHYNWFTTAPDGQTNLMPPSEYAAARARLPLSHLNILSVFLGLPKISMGAN